MYRLKSSIKDVAIEISKIHIMGRQIKYSDTEKDIRYINQNLYIRNFKNIVQNV